MSGFPRNFGNYILERELGRGGMAAVHLARHIALDRRVAIKILLNQSDDALERFKREAELTSQLDHPHIIKIYDYGQQGPFAYTIMDAALGGSLRNRLETVPGNRLEPAEAFRIFTQVGEALDFAHAKGIIHRDVSPGNILLDETGQRALLADFGIARSEKHIQNLTSSGMILGTPEYFSPEHVQGARSVTAQSDIFSLGVVLYIMLTGKSPWGGPRDPINPEFPDPAPVSAYITLPADINVIMQTLLAIEPTKRYQTVGEAITALADTVPEYFIGYQDDPRADTVARTVFLDPDFKLTKGQHNDVEQLLGAQLERSIITEAHQRAEAFSDPARLIEMLDLWSSEGRFRQRHLGRLATFQKVSSRNIYFYQLDVLYETRFEPFTWEKPDRERKPMSNEPEQAVWDVKLPTPQSFTADAGTFDLIPGSAHVSQCSTCKGKGNITCQTCKGNGRITITRTVERPVEGRDGAKQTTTTTVENIVQACPDCGGKGHPQCPTCQSIGMVIRSKGFKWDRRPVTTTTRDDVAAIDEAALEPEAQEVYNQIVSHIPATWRQIANLDTLVRNAEQQTDPNTRIVRAQLKIRMVPVTKVEFDLGRQPGASSPSGETKTLHFLGLNNNVSESEARAFQDWSRISTIGIIAFLLLLVVMMLVFILFVY